MSFERMDVHRNTLTDLSQLTDIPMDLSLCQDVLTELTCFMDV